MKCTEEMYVLRLINKTKCDMFFAGNIVFLWEEDPQTDQTCK